MWRPRRFWISIRMPNERKNNCSFGNWHSVFMLRWQAQNPPCRLIVIMNSQLIINIHSQFFFNFISFCSDCRLLMSLFLSLPRLPPMSFAATRTPAFQFESITVWGWTINIYASTDKLASPAKQILFFRSLSLWRIPLSFECVCP